MKHKDLIGIFELLRKEDVSNIDRLCTMQAMVDVGINLNWVDVDAIAGFIEEVWGNKYRGYDFRGFDKYDLAYAIKKVNEEDWLTKPFEELILDDDYIEAIFDCLYENKDVREM